MVPGRNARKRQLEARRVFVEKAGAARILARRLCRNPGL